MESSLQESSFILLMAIGILIMLALALAFVLFYNASQKRILKEHMENQKLALKHQEELLYSTILTQEEERKRIAKELHDEIGSKLNVIFLNMHRLGRFKSQDPEIGSISKEVNALINTTIDTTRRISHDLLPPTLEEFGLGEAIKELRDNYNQSGIIKIDLKLLKNEGKNYEKIIELNLFRVLQELISNSIRHGMATKIKIEVSFGFSSVQIRYRDNGKGFNADDPEKRRGLGLKNIESRLNMIEAVSKIDSGHGKGFSMDIDLIIKDALAEQVQKI